MADSEPMDVDKVLECLEKALDLQHRSLLEHLWAAGSMGGLAAQAVATRLWEFADEELVDLRRLIEKFATLKDERKDHHETVEKLIEHEVELLDALHAVIPHSGQQSDSEALEHLMEHVIMRKQNQVDWLRRAIREA